MRYEFLKLLKQKSVLVLVLLTTLLMLVPVLFYNSQDSENQMETMMLQSNNDSTELITRQTPSNDAHEKVIEEAEKELEVLRNYKAALESNDMNEILNAELAYTKSAY